LDLKVWFSITTTLEIIPEIANQICERLLKAQSKCIPHHNTSALQLWIFLKVKSKQHRLIPPPPKKKSRLSINYHNSKTPLTLLLTISKVL